MTQKLRAPFVWTPHQPIDPNGSRLHYLGAAAAAEREEPLVPVPQDGRAWRCAATAAELSITVDGRYVLYLNGARIGRGPVRCSPVFQRYDEYDLVEAASETRDQCTRGFWSTPTGATLRSTKQPRDSGSPYLRRWRPLGGRRGRVRRRRGVPGRPRPKLALRPIQRLDPGHAPIEPLSGLHRGLRRRSPANGVGLIATRLRRPRLGRGARR